MTGNHFDRTEKFIIRFSHVIHSVSNRIERFSDKYCSLRLVFLLGSDCLDILSLPVVPPFSAKSMLPFYSGSVPDEWHWKYHHQQSYGHEQKPVRCFPEKKTPKRHGAGA